MKDNEILLAAIQKAEANGFVMNKHKHFCEVGRDNFTGEIKSLGAYQSIIFDHDFAKSFWVQRKKTIIAKPDIEYSNRKPYLQTRKSGRNWRWHLQQMVILEKPIHYLEKFL